MVCNKSTYWAFKTKLKPHFWEIVVLNLSSKILWKIIKLNAEVFAFNFECIWKTMMEGLYMVVLSKCRFWQCTWKRLIRMWMPDGKIRMSRWLNSFIQWTICFSLFYPIDWAIENFKNHASILKIKLTFFNYSSSDIV